MTVVAGPLRVSHLTQILGSHRDRLSATSGSSRITLLHQSRKAAQALLGLRGLVSGAHLQLFMHVLVIFVAVDEVANFAAIAPFANVFGLLASHNLLDLGVAHAISLALLEPLGQLVSIRFFERLWHASACRILWAKEIVRLGGLQRRRHQILLATLVVYCLLLGTLLGKLYHESLFATGYGKCLEAHGQTVLGLVKGSLALEAELVAKFAGITPAILCNADALHQGSSVGGDLV